MMIEIFGLIVAAHALADYPLQGDFLSKAKNHKSPIPGLPLAALSALTCALVAGIVRQIDVMIIKEMKL